MSPLPGVTQELIQPEMISTEDDGDKSEQGKKETKGNLLVQKNR